MKRLLAALSFLLLILLIWVFWQKEGKPVTPTITEDITVEKNIDKNLNETTTNKTIKFKPEKRQVKVPVEKLGLEIEILSDENGVIITKIGDKEVNKKVSYKPVKRLSVREGIMTFWEVDEASQSLKYRSINLGAFIDRLD